MTVGGEPSFVVGPLALVTTPAIVSTNDEGFAAVAAWSFRDLLISDRDAGRAAQPLVRFEVARADSPWPRWGIWRDGEPCETTLDQGYVLFQLQWEFNRVVLEQHEATLHAATVATDGGAVLLCGSSMSGKTTLAGFLSSRGFGYLGDEVASLDSAGNVLAYRRPLGLRHNSPLAALFTHPPELDRAFDTYEMLVPVSTIDGANAAAIPPLPVRAVIFPRYLREYPTALRQIDKPTALARLCAASPGLARHGKTVFTRLARVVEQASCAELDTSDLGTARDLICTFLSTELAR